LRPADGRPAARSKGGDVQAPMGTEDAEAEIERYLRIGGYGSDQRAWRRS